MNDMRKKFYHLFLAAIIGCFATGMLTSCFTDDMPDNPVKPETPQTDTYDVELYGDNDEVYISLTDFWTILASLDEEDWAKLDNLSMDYDDDLLDVSFMDELDANGDPVLRIALKDPNKAATRGATRADDDMIPIEIKDSAGNTYIIRVSRKELLGGDTNSNFLTEWWKCEKIDLALKNGTRAVYAPWTVAGGANIPPIIRREIKPWNGWEMAFSFCNDAALQNGHYFGLYNKFTGQMRVFFYVEDPSGWGNDLTMSVFFGEDGDKNLYPLYNNMEFGIPSNHVMGTSLDPKAKILKDQKQTFQSWYTPFREGDAIETGWYCFEFDMSGYLPEGKDWLNEKTNSPLFKIHANTKSTFGVSLKTTLTGKLDGTFRNEQIIQHGGANATSGIFSGLGGLFSGIGGAVSGKIQSDAQWAYWMKQGVPERNPVAHWGGFACDMVGGVLSLIGGALEDPVTYDTIPGKINLALDATAQTDGYISGTTSNGMSPLAVGAQAIKNANVNTNVGQGVWGLADDPVIYVDQDDILSSYNRFNMAQHYKTKQVFGNATFPDCDVRMVYALDPTSVKVNINDKLFNNIQDVKVTANVAVLVNNDYGHTDVYRKMLKLGDRPTFSIVSRKKGQYDDYWSVDANSLPKSHAVGIEQLAVDEYDEKDCSTFAYKKDGHDWLRLHGRIVEAAGKKIIVEPQVFVPYVKDGQDGHSIHVDNATAPDFVVRVNVVFSADVNGETKWFNYGKCFIPKIELVDHDKMQSIANNLKDYATKCMNDQPVSTLANNSSIKVSHPTGHKYLSKTLGMLEAIGMIDMGSNSFLKNKNWVPKDKDFITHLGDVKRRSIGTAKLKDLFESSDKEHDYVCIREGRNGNPCWFSKTIYKYDPDKHDIYENSSEIPYLDKAKEISLKMLRPDWEFFDAICLDSKCDALRWAEWCLTRTSHRSGLHKFQDAVLIPGDDTMGRRGSDEKAHILLYIDSLADGQW